MGRKQRALLEAQRKIEADSKIYENPSVFRAVERGFKRRNACNCEQDMKGDSLIHEYGCGVDKHLLDTCLDLKDTSMTTVHKAALLSTLTPKAYTTLNPEIIAVDACAGLFVIKNMFTPAFQRDLISACLKTYHLPPNKTNLVSLY
jgi:hypothetical protein